MLGDLVLPPRSHRYLGIRQPFPSREITKPPLRPLFWALSSSEEGVQRALRKTILLLADETHLGRGEAAAYFQTVASKLFILPTDLHGMPLGASWVPSA